MSTLRTNNLQNPDSSNVNIELTQNGGAVVSGIVTASAGIEGNLTGNVTGTASNATGITTTQINVGDTFLKATNQVGLGQTDTTGRNAGINTAVGTLIYNTTDRQVQVYKSDGWKKVGHNYTQATGGIVNEYTLNGFLYRTHSFVSSGILEVQSVDDTNAIEALLVGAGGGGGQSLAGGGGGGAVVVLNTLPAFAGNTFTVTIGAGGVGDSDGETGDSGRRGETTSISHPGGTINATGGGGGVSRNAANLSSTPGANSGGSSGPGYSAGTATAPTLPASVSGNVYAGYTGGAGNNSAPAYGGGGGGGASANGQDGTDTYGGAGGAGYTVGAFDSTVPYIYGGGGGGGSYTGGYAGPGGAGGGGGGGSNNGQPNAGTGGTGGRSLGGDGVGSPLADLPGQNGGSGGHNTGGGGGSSAHQNNIAGNGGSGYVAFRYKVAAIGTAKATGGSVSFYNGKTIHTFTSSGSFVAPASFNETVEYVVVGGGGGAFHYDVGAGGGAGGYLTGTTPVSGPGTTTIQIGAGGQGRWATTPGLATDGAGGVGQPSYFGSIIGYGGGAGVYRAAAANEWNGGSGGGGGYNEPIGGSGNKVTSTNTDVAAPLSPQGNPGGGQSGAAPAYGGGGGGGAGAAGGQGSTTAAGDGGIGVQIPATFRHPELRIGTPGPAGFGYLAGGGGGSRNEPGLSPSDLGQGGAGGGGNGGSGDIVAENGLNGTGGGGGCGEYQAIPALGDAAGAIGSGGSGIVLVAYPT